jgi:AcrR family transcriptional regulator
MRIKDELKQEAVVRATVKLVNEIGFASSSVSKIAKEAGVSPATIYIYYKNKEDLLVSTYVSIKQHVGQFLLRDLDESLPIRDIIKRVWFNTFEYFNQNEAYFEFTEQFANSPYYELVDHEELEKTFAPMMRVLQRGIDQKILKDVSHTLLISFVFYPIITLSKHRLSHGFEQTPENIEQAFTLAWDAIKL